MDEPRKDQAGANGWDDLELPARILEDLRQIAANEHRRQRTGPTTPLLDKAVDHRGTAALFSGPSGTGKTLAAKVIATELGAALQVVDLSAVINKFIGETEKNLRQVFDAAKETNAVLLFDEADALFAKRTQTATSHDRHANIEVSYLLQRIESYTGLVILAVTSTAAIDSAFLRRMRFIVDFTRS